MKSFKEFNSYLNENVEEDRRPSVEYEYRTKTDKLTQKEAEDVAKVVAVLKKKQSEASLKLAKAFLSVDSRTKQLKEKLDTLKEKIRGEVVEKYFDAADEAFTRVIEMEQAVISISKKTMVKGEVKFDVDAFYAELLVLMPNIATLLLELKNKYTTIMPEKEKASTISVKGEAFEPSEIKRFFEMVVGKLLSLFDKGFDRLKRKYEINVDSEEILRGLSIEEKEVEKEEY